MNLLLKIVYTIINSISRYIQSLDRRTAETIRQSFFFFIFLLMIGGLFLGNFLGKNAAKHGGDPIIDKTNQSFDIDIKRARKRGHFQGMLQEELMREAEKSGTRKIPYPAREEEPVPMKDQILESTGTEEDKKEFPGTVDRDSPVDMPRTREKKESSEVIRHDREAPPVMEGREKPAKPGTAEKPAKDSSEKNDRVITGKKEELRPLEPDKGIVE